MNTEDIIITKEQIKQLDKLFNYDPGHSVEDILKLYENRDLTIPPAYIGAIILNRVYNSEYSQQLLKLINTRDPNVTNK